MSHSEWYVHIVCCFCLVRQNVLRICLPQVTIDPKLPHGLVIRTPPRSPAVCAAVLLPSLKPQLRNESANSPQAASGVSNHPISSGSVAEEDIWEVQQALVEAGEFDVSPYRKLRENLPFNRCMSQVLVIGTFYSARHSYKEVLTYSFVARSHSIHLSTLTAETWTPAFPRLFGANPSLELFGQQIFRLSNKELYRHSDLNHRWFFKWIAISADFALLRTFFSINTPTVGAVYERLLEYSGMLLMADLLRVLFELRHVLRPNNPKSVKEADFLRIAVSIGSRPGNTLDVVKSCLINNISVSATVHQDFATSTGDCILQTAARCDIAMLRVLVEAGWQLGSHFRVFGDMMGRIMNHIFNWDSQQEDSLMAYIELLLRSGILNGSALPHCVDDKRPKVISQPIAICCITWDEVIMLCPPTMRQTLQIIFMNLISDQGTCISRAGVFTVAQDGSTGLRAYLEAHREADAFLTRVTLEECLIFAVVVNDLKTVSVLLEVGVDPYVGLLSNNLERYRKGVLPWNPSIVAAAAGHLEVLALLLSHVNPRSFLEYAPIYELLTHHKIRRRGEKPQFMGSDLCRLKNLQQSYLLAQIRSSNLAVGGSLDELSDTLIANRSRTLEFIRSIAHAQHLGEKVDLEIIEAAVSRIRTPWLLEQKQHLPCDALLMKGLIDAHLQYQAKGMDLLHLAIRNHCSFTVVRFLSDKGFKVHSNLGGQSRHSMLHDALLSNSRDRSQIVDFLLENGADCKVYKEGLSILEASLWNYPQGMEDRSEYKRVFERLFDAGAPVHHQPQKGVSNWRPLVYRLLLLDVSDDLILRVVDAGAPLNACGYGYKHVLLNPTPLQAALMFGRERLARELIRRGADVHAPAPPRYGLTVLQAACLLNLPVHFLEYLVVVLGVKIDEPPAKTNGFTSLAAAASEGSLNTVEFLLDHGADVNATCRIDRASFADDKNTLVRPLDLAVLSGSLDKVELLLKAGGRSREDGLGGAMSFAARKGHFAVLSILQIWNERNGHRILDEEALWQRRNPEQALMLSESTDVPYDSDTDDEEDDDGSEEGEE